MLAPWKKKYDKLRQHIKKQRHHFANKGLYSQCYGFSSRYIWMWDLEYKEGWVPKRIDVFKPLCWRRLLRVPWTTRRSNQSVLKEINLEYSLKKTDAEAETAILWPPYAKCQLIGKTLMVGKIEGKRKRGWQRLRWLEGITDSMNMSLSKLRETVKVKEVWSAAVQGVAKALDMTAT